MEDLAFTVKLGQMYWHFSAPVVVALEGLGVPIPDGLTSFILKVLSMKIIREGTTEFTLMGLGLRVFQEGDEFTVRLIEESEIN